MNDEDGETMRLILQRAPVDRAWYRRGWLVMLRIRWLKEKEEKEEEEEEEKKEGSGQRHRGDGSGGGDVGDGAHQLASVVHKMIEVEEDGVFRCFVSFV